MSKLMVKFKALSGKATRKEGDIPSGVDLSHLKQGLGMLSNIAEAAGITPLSKTAEIIKGIVEIVEVVCSHDTLRIYTKICLEKGRKSRGHQGFCSIYNPSPSNSERNCTYKWW